MTATATAPRVDEAPHAGAAARFAADPAGSWSRPYTEVISGGPWGRCEVCARPSQECRCPEHGCGDDGTDTCRCPRPEGDRS